MRRRLRGDRSLTAEQLVDLYDQARATHAKGSPEVARHAVNETLRDYGYDPVDAIRARRWLRRGQPPADHWAWPLTERSPPAAPDIQSPGGSHG